MAESDTNEFQVRSAARSAVERISNPDFPLAVRGYEREAVDRFVEQVVHIVSELEATQTRESVVQRALAEVGEQTTAILQRAHETADEIAARSRAQADGRLERAEREAELLRRQAEEYSDQIVSDTRVLWDERQRLIQDLRQLADEVLATAEDAGERLSLPELLEDAEEAAAHDPDATQEHPQLTGIEPEDEPGAVEDGIEPLEDDDPTTSEVELDVLPGGADEEERRG